VDEKFWGATLDGVKLTTRSGKIGKAGAGTSKTFPDQEKALKEYNKIVAAKKKKGYADADAHQQHPLQSSVVAHPTKGASLYASSALGQKRRVEDHDNLPSKNIRQSLTKKTSIQSQPSSASNFTFVAGAAPPSSDFTFIWPLKDPSHTTPTLDLWEPPISSKQKIKLHWRDFQVNDELEVETLGWHHSTVINRRTDSIQIHITGWAKNCDGNDYFTRLQSFTRRSNFSVCLILIDVLTIILCITILEWYTWIQHTIYVICMSLILMCFSDVQ
jgi:predicted DNA-binding WGR domain protein